MSETSNPTAAIVEQIDGMVNDGNLTTRTGLRLIISVFREGMIIVGNMDQRMSELETAYVRFTTTMSNAKELEEQNKKALTEIVPIFKAVKWIGGILTTLLAAFLIALVTGQIKIVRP